MKSNLLLHCGAAKVERQQVLEVSCPAPTDTWNPLPHGRLIESVESAVRNVGYEITGEAHALTHEGARYFGLLEVNRPNESKEDYSYVLGIRGSTDKSFSSGVCVGSQVFVCDNLAFNGEIKFNRKYTINIERDLPLLTARIIGALSEKWTSLNERIATYKTVEVSDKDAHDLLVRSVDVGACPITHLPHVLKEWRQPRHPEFQPRTAWSLFNAYTEAFKPSEARRGVGLAVLPERTTKLHGLVDAFCGRGNQSLLLTESVEDAEIIVA